MWKLTPAQHIAWIRHTSDYLLGIDDGLLDSEVPACPGWTVRDVLGHLGVAGALSFPAMMRTSPDGDGMAASSEALATAGDAAGEIALRTNMMGLLEALEQLDYSAPVWTPSGVPADGAYWPAHIGGEFAVHTDDVALAVGDDRSISEDQAADGLVWVVEHILPTAFGLFGIQVPRQSR